MNCLQCRTDNPAAAKFCQECGAALPAPQRIEGERRFVTVLFADVVGSTAMGEQLDPEQITEIMNGAFATFNAAVARYGGTISRLMGDAVLALFGAPIAHEDDAERAVRAALEIQAAAAAYARQVDRLYGVDFRVRIGIHSGLAVLTFVGDELKTEYTAMGDTTNVASRLQSAAEPGTILISAETHQLVRHAVRATGREPLDVKGKSAPLQTYEVLGLREAPGKARGLDRAGSPLVGRSRELLLLRDKIEALQQGHSSFVAVAGEAGIGKSRLIAELRKAVQRVAPEIGWLEGRAVSFGQSMAYYPWQQVLAESIGAPVDEPIPSMRDKLSVACDRYGVDASHRPVLEAMLGVESEASAAALVDVKGSELVERISAAVTIYLQGLSTASPVVLVFDDMHWADDASVELFLPLAALVERDTPVLFLCIHRQDKDTLSHAVTNRLRERLGERFTELTLEPLTRSQSQELVTGLLEIEGLPDAVCDRILSRSEGNPLFLEEIMRALIDTQQIVREQDRWRAAPQIGNVNIPDTLVGVLSARIDRLPADAKRILLSAAVIGRIFAYRVLEELCRTTQPPDPCPELKPQLGTLTAEELIRERARDPELEYIFKHALTQEAAYNLLLLRSRKEFHGRVAAALERIYPDRLDDLAATLERHFCLAEQWGQCADYSMRAAARAERLYAQTVAFEHYEQAYEALDKLPESDDQRAKLCDAVIKWTRIAVKLTPMEVVLERLQRVEQIARALGDKRRLARILVWIANVHFLSGFRNRGMPALQEGYRLSQELGAEQLSVLPLFILTSMIVDDAPREAIPQLVDVIALAHKYHLDEIEAHALASKAMAHARLGEVDEARVEIARALEAAQSISSQLIIGDVEMAVGSAYLDLGDIEKALEYERVGAERAVQAKGMECACEGFFVQGMMHLKRRDGLAALAALERSFDFSQHVEVDVLKNRARATLALARVVAGRLDELPHLEAGLANARALGDEFFAAFLALGLAEVSVQQGQIEQAEELYQTALDYYRGRGMRPYIASTLQSLAPLYRRQGRHAEADAATAEAERISAELGLPDAAAVKA